MDPLTEEEAIVILLHMHEGYNRDDVREVYRQWGGSLRRLNADLLRNDYFYDLISRLDNAFRDCGSHVPTDCDVRVR